MVESGVGQIRDGEEIVWEDAHFCVDDCVKVPKIQPYFLTHGLPRDVLTYGAFLVMINTDAQTVAQNVGTGQIYMMHTTA